ncbi:MAG: UxaA family hydrolase [Granulosicoccus sp.]
MSEKNDRQVDVKTDPRLIQLSPRDNVLVLRDVIEGGEKICVSGTHVVIKQRIGLGHKLASKAILSDEKVIKYGAPIGSATLDIGVGEHVHIHNIKSNYTPTLSLEEENDSVTQSHA